MVKKVVILAFVLLVAGGVGFYYYYQSTLDYLPEWYAEDGERPTVDGTRSTDDGPRQTVDGGAEMPIEKDDEKEGEEKKSKKLTAKSQSETPQKNTQKLTVEKVTRSLKSDKTVRLTSTELDDLIRNSITEKFPDQKNEFLKGVKSEIDKEKVDIEMVIDIDKMPWEEFPPQAQFAKTLLKQFGGVKNNSDLFVKVTGKPTVQDDELVFGDNTLLQVGKIQYNLKSFAALPGFSENVGRIPLKKLAFKDVQLEDGAMVLSR